MKGFTLVELLVVMSIIALLGIFGFANFKRLAQSQVVNKAVIQVQTALREAQSNATAGVLCAGTWSVKLNTTGVDLKCDSTKTYVLENAQISSITCSSGTSLTLPVTISFTPLSGLLSFSGTSGTDVCLSSTPSLIVKLVNVKDSSLFKTVTINKGGGISVQ